MGAKEEIETLWCSHLQYVLLTRNCHRVTGSSTPPVTVDYLNMVLPPLAFLRTVSLLDESLQKYLDETGRTLSRPYRNDLNGRIQFLADQRLITNSDALHALRERRNEIAHHAAAAFAGDNRLQWSDVDSAIDAVEDALQDLGLVNERPAYQFHYGRDVDFYDDHPPPDKPHVRLTHHYYYGIKHNEDWVVKFQKSIDYYQMHARGDAG